MTSTTSLEILVSQVQCRRAFDFETQAVEFVKSKVVVGRKNCDHCVSSFLTRHDGLCFCHNRTGLFEVDGIICNPRERRLFFDISSRSVKAVLFYNGGIYVVAWITRCRSKSNTTASWSCWMH